jgi:hypothetical protein
LFLIAFLCALAALRELGFAVAFDHYEIDSVLKA